jgi:hypothetical protein
MEITNGQPWQNSSQNSVFWRGAECHCQVAEFLLKNCPGSLLILSPPAAPPCSAIGYQRDSSVRWLFGLFISLLFGQKVFWKFFEFVLLLTKVGRDFCSFDAVLKHGYPEHLQWRVVPA